MPMRIKRLIVSINFFQPRVGQRASELVVNHLDSSLERLHRAGLGLTRRRERHIQIVEHGNESFQERLIGKLDRFLALARGALFEILKIRCDSEQTIPMFIRFGGLGF